MTSIFKKLESISAACDEIQLVLKEHLDKTSNQNYKIEIEKDIVTLENLKCIAIAVREDIESDKIGGCTELLLRIAANEFKNKLIKIPENKALSKEIMLSLKEIHREILHHTIKSKS
jgi:hypothetical protein